MIAVATLLVAVVGATFAYFTASTSGGNVSGATTTAKTVKMAQVGLSAQPDGTSSNKIYPGTMNFVGASLTASITNQDELGDDSKSYEVTYTIKGKVNLSEAFSSQVKWRLYRVTSSKSTTAVTCEEVSAVGADAELHYSQKCTEDESFVDTGDYPDTKTLVSSGLASNQGNNEISVTEEKIKTGETAYYYLVVEYENTESPQDDDKDKTITLSLDSFTATGTAEVKAS